MEKSLKRMTDFLVELGIERIPHTRKSYLGHLISVHRLMETQGCDAELCLAGLFHSIYGTQLIQGFKLDLDRRSELRAMIGDRAERLAYLNCFMNRDTFDRAVEQTAEPYRILNRETGEDLQVSATEFEDLCRVHFYDWLEQVPRSELGWDYRRTAFRHIAQRLGGKARECYDRVFAGEKEPQPV